MIAGMAGMGVADDHTGPLADVLIDAELRGYDDHGVFFLGELAKWWRAGALNPAPNIKVVRETESSLLLDGDKGSAVVASYRAMRWCTEKAKARGMATAGIQNSGHFVAAAPYPTEAAQAGVIALCAANVVPLMPAPGGRSRALGTNPICFAAPTGGDHPLVFDMATSAISGFKVRVMAQQGKTLEPGLLVDKDGVPSTDPNDLDKGGMVLPVGGYKGFGMAMVVEILAGVLTGAQFGANAGVVNGKEGHWFMAIDPSVFMPREQFVSRMDELVAHVKGGQKIEGVNEIVYPGERGQRRAAEVTRAGKVALDSVAWRTLQEVCNPVGAPLPD